MDIEYEISGYNRVQIWVKFKGFLTALPCSAYLFSCPDQLIVLVLVVENDKLVWAREQCVLRLLFLVFSKSGLVLSYIYGFHMSNYSGLLSWSWSSMI